MTDGQLSHDWRDLELMETKEFKPSKDVIGNYIIEQLRDDNNGALGVERKETVDVKEIDRVRDELITLNDDLNLLIKALEKCVENMKKIDKNCTINLYNVNADILRYVQSCKYESKELDRYATLAREAHVYWEEKIKLEKRRNHLLNILPELASVTDISEKERARIQQLLRPRDPKNK